MSMQVLRTPDSAFLGLPSFPWEPQYFTSRLFGAEVRMAYYDLCDAEPAAATGETVLLTHGEPSWSYLNRRLVPPLLAAGHRVVLFDQVGFGRSDKPARESDHSYSRHIQWNVDLLVNHLDLRGITALFQDWGGLLGLRVVAAHPDRFRRLCVANTILPDADAIGVPDGFYAWKEFAHKSQLAGDNAIAKMMGRGTAGPSAGPDGKITAEEAAAYGAPYPTEAYKAGVRIFPELVPTPPSDPTGRPQPVQGPENAAAWRTLAKLGIPIVTAFGDKDVVLGECDATFQKRCLGCAGQPHTRIPGAGHFVQDGGGDALGRVLLGLIARPWYAGKL